MSVLCISIFQYFFYNICWHFFNNIDNIINRSKGDYAYTLLDLDESDESKIQELVDKFENSDNIVRVRLIKK